MTAYSAGGEDDVARPGADVVALYDALEEILSGSQRERLLDQVGWASDLMDARRLAEKHGRPLFVFTYSGSTTRANAIALQRC